MNCRISEFRDKQVVCINSGCALGPVCDVEVNTSTGQLCSIIVFGRCRFFGLFGREEDFIIPWNEIKIIGPDTILVGITPPEFKGRNHFFRRFNKH